MNYDGGVTKVNGAAYQDFAVTGGLHVYLGSGDDLFALGATGQLPTFKDVIIHMSEVNSNGSSDKDSVIIWGVTATELLVNTSTGNDTVFVSNATITGGGYRYFQIDTGAGADEITVTNSPNLNAYSAIYAGNSTENDVDKVRINNVSVGYYCFLTVSLGGGDDELNMTNVWVQTDIGITAGGGNDKVELRTVTAVDELMASLGEGSDTLLLDDVHAGTH